MIVEDAVLPSARYDPCLETLLADLPDPEIEAFEPGRPRSILVTGIGGTGVVTIGAVLAMAAHIDGLSAHVVDVLGMAQKGGSVIGHIRLATSDAAIDVIKLEKRSADLVIGCDLLGTAETSTLDRIRHGHTDVIVNTEETVTGAFPVDPDTRFPTELARSRITRVSGDKCLFVDATRVATALCGDALATNMFMLGLAWQRGDIPITLSAIDTAIRLNGVAVDMNRRAFAFCRLMAHDQDALCSVIEGPASSPKEETLDERIERRAAHLQDYQDQAYAERFRTLVRRAADTDRRIGRHDLTVAVAESYFRLLAYKDEYEVARLYSTSSFRDELDGAFGSKGRINVLLAPPVLSRPDPTTGKIKKR